MTTAKPLARYSAVEGALASGLAIAEIHHLSGRDPRSLDLDDQRIVS
jgi:transposase